MEQPISKEERIDDIVSVLAADDPSEVDTSKYEAKSAHDSGNRATEPDYQGDDSVKTRQIELPVLRNYDDATPQHVEAVKNELLSAVEQIEQLYQTNQISHEQYQQAVLNAGKMAEQVKQLDISARANLVRAKEFEQQFHTQTAELVPGWQDLNKRQHIVSEIENLCGKYGITKDELAAYQLSPKIVAMMTDLVKKTSPKPKVPQQRQQFKQDPDQRPSMPLSANRGRGGDIDAIANLLVSNGIK